MMCVTDDGGAVLRMMLRVTIPVEKGNAAIKDGSLARIIQSALQELKAEAAYFTAMDGMRTGLIFFDLPAASDIPRIAEPLFMGLDAALEFSPVMNADDLKAGLGKVKV